MNMTDEKFRLWQNQQVKNFRRGKLSSSQIRKLEDAGLFLRKNESERKFKSRILMYAKLNIPVESEDMEKFTAFTTSTSRCFDRRFTMAVKDFQKGWVNYKGNRPDSFYTESQAKLLEMARKGEQRPNSKKTQLGHYLVQATCKTCLLYDSSFDDQIRAVIPAWFVKSKIKTAQRKEEILKLAESGGARPKKEHELYRYFKWYINKGCRCFDIELRNKLEALRPDWFKIKRTETE